MNDQLQQFLNLQQALAAAATAAIFNTIQQAANIAATTPPNSTNNALNDANIPDLQQQLQDSRHSPLEESISPLPPAIPPTSLPEIAPNAQNSADCNAKIQELLLQLRQQATVGQSPLALNLNLLAQQQQQQQALDGLINHSPSARLAQDFQLASATTSNNLQSTAQVSPNKKLRRHQHSQSQPPQPFHNRSLDATSKPHNAPPKSISNINSSGGSSRHGGTSNTGSSSSSAFMANNVSLPRKLVRGQDVWLGRGPEQTRQIFKCMWCGTSFRTLDEMAEHMRITKHHTNLVSPEQITSWKHHGNTSSSSNSKHNKQPQTRSNEDNQDDLSEKFDDSDRDSSFNNDDDLNQPRRSNHQSGSKHDVNKNNESSKNSSKLELSQGESQKSVKQQNSTSTSKPLTRSRKRDSDSVPIKRDRNDRENSPATSASSHKQQNSPTGSNSSSNLILGDVNEDSKINQDHSKLNGKSQKSSEKIKENSPSSDNDDADADMDESKREVKNDENDKSDLNNDTKDEDSDVRADENKNAQEKSVKEALSDGNDNTDEENENREESTTEKEENDDSVDNDNVEDDKTSEIDESMPASSSTTACAAKASQLGPKGETGDPLSALETMVEKSFDPRLRPGVANGGILQRLGIDEEVCPPWQHINYANWYAAAAYSHPMAAALLAAGMNLQNGMKLSKNLGAKKSDD